MGEHGRLPLGNLGRDLRIAGDPDGVLPDPPAERGRERRRDRRDQHRDPLSGAAASPAVATRHALDDGETHEHRREDEAAVEVGPDRPDDRNGPHRAWTSPVRGEHHQRECEQRHGQELRPKRQGGRVDEERGEGQQRGGSRVHRRGTHPDRDEDQPAHEADEHGPEQHQTGPAGGREDLRQEDLGAPLLVEPRQACGRERPRVHHRDP